MNPHKQFFFHLGKHEDQSLAILPMYHETGFDSPVKAMESLQTILRQWVRGSVSKCCLRNQEDEEAKYCKTCGKPITLSSEQEEVDEMVMEVFSAMFELTLDSIAQKKTFYKALLSGGWNPGMVATTSPGEEKEEPTFLMNGDRWLYDGGEAFLCWTYKGEDFSHQWGPG